MWKVVSVIVAGLVTVAYMVWSVTTMDVRAERAGQVVVDSVQSHYRRTGSLPKSLTEMGFETRDGDIRVTNVCNFDCVYYLTGDTHFGVSVVMDYEMVRAYDSRTKEWVSKRR